ncbi:pirin family protein [Hymenobacter humi]
MAQSVLHRAATRGHANHGWLNSYHTFSFAGYQNPERMHFGALRVLNDDTVAGGMGFGKHPHDNMEIISIPLSGDLEHQDTTGRQAVIRQGDVQIMSAGTGLAHSEKNHNRDKEVKFLQIWVFPNQENVAPRYAQQSFRPEDRHNKLLQVVSPSPDDHGVWIHQDAWFHLGQARPGLPHRLSAQEARQRRVCVCAGRRCDHQRRGFAPPRRPGCLGNRHPNHPGRQQRRNPADGSADGVLMEWIGC